MDIIFRKRMIKLGWECKISTNVICNGRNSVESLRNGNKLVYPPSKLRKQENPNENLIERYWKVVLSPAHDGQWPFMRLGLRRFIIISKQTGYVLGMNINKKHYMRQDPAW